MNIHTVTVESWADVHAYSKPGWLFRGQRLASWHLRSAIERLFDHVKNVPAARREGLEHDLLREFVRGYHNYAPRVPRKDAQLEWRALMQHHGAPTRLLDFTYSLYVASYFALETAGDEEPSAVWAVRGPWALHESMRLMKKAGVPDASKLNAPLEEGGEALYEHTVFRPQSTPLVVPLNPFHLNERLRVQKGVFLVPGSLLTSYTENLHSLPGSDSSENVFRLLLSPTIRREALEQLYYMNISRTSLFPGVDGYAQSLGVFHPHFNPVNWHDQR